MNTPSEKPAEPQPEPSSPEKAEEDKRMKRRRRWKLRVWVYGSILLLLVLLCVAGYFVMIDVKPDVARPQPTEAERLEIEELEKSLSRHLDVLSNQIGPRSVSYIEGLRKAADTIEAFWIANGFEVQREPSKADRWTCDNLYVEQAGRLGKGEILLVGAHYDSVGCPGADDNGSGVAALLEISRRLHGETFARTIRYVAFVNEEPPHFQTDEMGSLVHARGCAKRGENIVAMVVLEMLGYYSDEPDSQKYPPPLGFFYPEEGNFIAVVGNLYSRGLVVDTLQFFMEASDFPVEGIATFEWLPGIGLSDHWSFWQQGYDAVMITDTAMFRNPYYHTSQDTPENLDFHSFARVTHGLLGVIRGLAGGG